MSDPATPPPYPTVEILEDAWRFLQRERPDLLERWGEHEERDEGYADIFVDLSTMLRENGFYPTVTQGTDMLRALRKKVRIHLGLWV